MLQTLSQVRPSCHLEYHSVRQRNVECTDHIICRLFGILVVLLQCVPALHQPTVDQRLVHIKYQCLVSSDLPKHDLLRDLVIPRLS